MLVSPGATILVADGARVELYRNSGDAVRLKLSPVAAPELESHSKDSGKRRRVSAANPDVHTAEEDSFLAAVADWLNREASQRRIDRLVVIAAPRALGELRRRYGRELKQKIIAELAKELVGRPASEIEAALVDAKAA